MNMSMIKLTAVAVACMIPMIAYAQPQGAASTAQGHEPQSATPPAWLLKELESPKQRQAGEQQRTAGEGIPVRIVGGDDNAREIEIQMLKQTITLSQALFDIRQTEAQILSELQRLSASHLQPDSK